MNQRYLYVYYAEADREQAESILNAMQTCQPPVSYKGGSQFTEQDHDSITHCCTVVLFLSQKALQSQTLAQVLNRANQCSKPLLLVYLEDIPLCEGIHYQFGWGNPSITYKGNALDTARRLALCVSPVESDTGYPMSKEWSCRAFSDDDYIQEYRCGKFDQVYHTTEFSVPASPPPASACTPQPNFAPAAQASYNWMDPPPSPACPKKSRPSRFKKSRSSRSTVAYSLSDNHSVKEQTPTLVLSPTRKKTIGEWLKNLVVRHPLIDVNFSVLAPKMLANGRHSVVDVYAYEDAFRHIVDNIKVQRAQTEGDIAETDGGRLKARKGATITIRLASPDITITDNEESREWTGQYTKFDFPVFVPIEYQRDQIAFCATVYFDGVIATRIHFALDCNKKQPQQPTLEQHNIRSAFISYASGDRESVSLILQGLRCSRPDLNVFFDIETIRSGEAWETILRPAIDQRDILYLCWSPLAKESPWVDMEWRYALKQKGLDGIEPMPLVLPEECAPPEELKSKHFGAIELYYRGRNK